MKKRIFTDHALDQSSEQFLYENSKKTGVIYIIIIIATIIAFTSIFFIKIDIGVQSTAQIKPKGEHIVINSPSTGKIVFNNLFENLKVSKGDTLLKINAKSISSQLSALYTRKAELVIMINDLQILTRSDSRGKVSSHIYRQDQAYFDTQLYDLNQKKESVEKNYILDEKLFSSGIISSYDFEKVKSDYNNSINSITLLKDRYQSEWENDKKLLEVELRNIETQLADVQTQEAELIITAPVDGTVTQIKNISNHTFVHSGQPLFEISPKGLLIAECYILPKDVGLLHIGQHCRIQIDAYNYNDWGVITGEIIDVFDDIIPSPDNSYQYYMIYCSLDKDTLSLKNGYTRSAKKGMSARVRFIVTERTLFQLLYDKIDDWVNPNIRG